MNEPTDLKTPNDASAAVGLRMCKQMSVPGVCRGALTHWRQLQAAVAELTQNDPSRPAFSARDLPSATQLGGPAQLSAALAIAPNLLHGPTPPADVYGRFVWLTLRVYEESRSVQMTLQQLPALVDSVKGNRADAGALLREALAGNGGLAQRARAIRGLADAFAVQLHGLGDALSAVQLPAAGSGSGAPAETAPASACSEGTVAQGIGAYAQARMSGNEAQQDHAQQRMEAARATVLSVIGNMIMAVETLSSAWEATATQFATVADGDVRQLGNPDYLHTNLQIESAVQDWTAFSEVIQAFIQGLLVVPIAAAR